MDTIDRWDAAQRTRLASAAEVASHWRTIAGLLPDRCGVTVADVLVNTPAKPGGSTELELSVKFFELLSERQVACTDLWTAMTEAGLSAHVPSGDAIERLAGALSGVAVTTNTRSHFRISTFNLPLPRSDFHIVPRAAIDAALSTDVKSSSFDGKSLGQSDDYRAIDIPSTEQVHVDA
eukprot:TRINITY_DN6106_c0_g1_i2.p1 TRINITY_DN6106_c0_g1~~TRINITY_DN6106_c0_g1_i2.p1  ORF type:complete len:178 (+),score=23.39 TRINITY_DN6106_c0_g1_i2:194-727(+)